MGYCVYENYPTDKARIHFGHCPYAASNGAEDCPRPPTPRGRWHGPFDTFEEALTRAQETGRQVSTCRHCRPR